jgi:glycerol-3-phosphate cytidylyltransferase-like family protein
MAILTIDQARAYATHLGRDGKCLVIADGIVDVLLPSHVAFFEKARSQGDALLVLVLTGVQRVADARPALLTPDPERAEIVASLAHVDAVALASEAELPALRRDLAANGAIDAGTSTAPDEESRELLRTMRRSNAR